MNNQSTTPDVELTGNWNDLVKKDNSKTCLYAKIEKQATWLTFAVALIALMAAVYHVI